MDPKGSFELPASSLQEDSKGSNTFRSKIVTGNSNLLLRLFVLGVRLAPFAVLLEFDFARDKLTVLAGPVVGPVALAAREPEKLIL